MAWWFGRWFGKEITPEIEQAIQDRLAEEARKLLNELLTNYTAPPPPIIGIGFKLRATDTGQTFMVIDRRQVRPGDLHYCDGAVRHAADTPSLHYCWIVAEIRPQQAPPPPPPRPAGDRLARHLRTLGFKKAEHPTAEDVRARYLDLAKRYHPDVNPRGAERMKRVTEAYRCYQELTKWKTTTP